MKQFFQVASTSGHVYEVPVAVVAANRAAAMLELHPDEFPTIKESMEDTVELFKDDIGQVRDWAMNQMNWAPDIEKHARLIRFTPPSAPWGEGEWSYHDHRAITGELDAATIMSSPVEFVVSVMAESSQMCSVTVLNNEAGDPFGAVVVVNGDSGIVNSFVQTLKYTADHISKTIAADAPELH